MIDIIKVMIILVQLFMGRVLLFILRVLPGKFTTLLLNWLLAWSFTATKRLKAIQARRMGRKQVKITDLNLHRMSKKGLLEMRERLLLFKRIMEPDQFNQKGYNKQLRKVNVAISKCKR